MTFQESVRGGKSETLSMTTNDFRNNFIPKKKKQYSLCPKTENLPAFWQIKVIVRGPFINRIHPEEINFCLAR